jgi:HD-like signal output (HDOD) protein
MNTTSQLHAAIEQQLRTARLPTLPAIAVKLIALGRSACANVDTLTEIVSQDPAIAANLVRLANSALYHRGNPAGTLAEATSRLGFERSRVIAMSATVLPAMHSVAVPGLPHSEYWRRSLIAGITARAICRHLYPNDVEATFLAAMLQDIGILLLAQLSNNPYSSISAETYTHDAAIDCERRLIKEDHGAVGAWWLEQWGFPARFVSAVRLSNVPGLTPPIADQDNFSGVVRAAGLLADLWMGERSAERLVSRQSEVSRRLGVDWQEIVELFADVSSEIPLAEALCDVQISDVKNLQLALTTLRELPEPETDVC